MFSTTYGASMSNFITLRTSNGSTCRIRLSFLDAQLSLQDGWPRFVSRNLVSAGSSVVFTYAGNSIFDVLVFDENGRETPGSACVQNPWLQRTQLSFNPPHSINIQYSFIIMFIFSPHYFVDADQSTPAFFCAMDVILEDEERSAILSIAEVVRPKVPVYVFRVKPSCGLRGIMVNFKTCYISGLVALFS